MTTYLFSVDFQKWTLYLYVLVSKCFNKGQNTGKTPFHQVNWSDKFQDSPVSYKAQTKQARQTHRSVKMLPIAMAGLEKSSTH